MHSIITRTNIFIFAQIIYFNSQTNLTIFSTFASTFIFHYISFCKLFHNNPLPSNTPTPRKIRQNNNSIINSFVFCACSNTYYLDASSAYNNHPCDPRKPVKHLHKKDLLHQNRLLLNDPLILLSSFVSFISILCKSSSSTFKYPRANNSRYSSLFTNRSELNPENISYSFVQPQ